MINTGKVAVYDIDNTLCKKKLPHQSYLDVEPIEEVCEHLRQLHRSGVSIILYTSRQMRTYNGNVGQILANTAPMLFDWLNIHDIPYDEIHFGKPWCAEGFYVDDRALRPNEVVGKTYEECVTYLEEVSK